MKIAIIHPGFKTKGGAENAILWICQALSENTDWDVTVFSVDFSGWEQKFRGISRVTVEKIPIPEVLRRFKFLVLIFSAVYLSRKLKDFDIINPYNYPSSLWVGLANVISAGKLPKIAWYCFEPARFLYKKICNRHTPEFLQVRSCELNENLEIKLTSRIKIFIKNVYKPMLRCVDKKVVRNFSSVLTLSDFVNEHVREIYGISNVTTCNLGIKNTKRSVDTCALADSVFFLSVCRLEAIKNIQKVIKAFYILKKENRLGQLKYYIVGTGPFEKNLRDLIDNYDLDKQVILCGYIKSEKLSGYYANCLAYIYLPFDEPFGLPYLEAASFSKPSIASNHGGPSELVIDNQTGLLTDPNDVNMIAQKIELMFSSAKERERMSINAYKYFCDNFMLDQYINRYITEIKNVLHEEYNRK